MSELIANGWRQEDAERALADLYAKSASLRTALLIAGGIVILLAEAALIWFILKK